VQVALEKLKDKGIIKLDNRTQLWQYCRKNNIILRHSIKRNCLKRDLLKYGD